MTSSSISVSPERFEPPSAQTPPQWVPIKRLDRRDSAAMVKHLLKLDGDDRYLRFGYAASDDQIARYIESIHWSSDQLLGVYNRELHLVALVHLAGPTEEKEPREAELGISVSAHLRGKGYGKRLFEHAMLLCRNRGITTLRIHALSENRAMLHLAQSAGALVERDGSEAQAVLRLPSSTLYTWWEAWLEDRAAVLDFTVKQWNHDGAPSTEEGTAPPDA